MTTVDPDAGLRRYVRKQTITAIALNCVMNATYTWYLWRGLDVATFFGPERIALDLAMTPLVIGFLSVLFGTAKARAGLEHSDRAWRIWDRAPVNVLLRGLVFATAAGVLFGVPIWAMLLPLDSVGLHPFAMSGIKVAITVLVTAFVVPSVIYAAVRDAMREPDGRSAK